MKFKNILTGALAVAALSSVPAFAVETQTGSGETNGYKLVWQDLFDGTELSDSRWNIEVNGDGGGNSELQYYSARPKNVHVGKDDKGNGCLILTAIRENYNGKNFTSGRVTTKNKVAFKHGKVEAAIKLPTTANGLWPAFWMMGNDFDQVGWPDCGETDIMEFGHQNGIKNGTTDRFFNGACHWGPFVNGGHPNYAKDATWDYSLQDGEFHLFTCIWDDEKIAMYCDLDRNPDSKPYYEIGIKDVNPEVASTAGNYFHKENFILFNLAVGGHFPGIYNATGITALNDGNDNQASMYINYVKVYQKGDASESRTLPAGDTGDVEGYDPENPPTPPTPPTPIEWESSDIWASAEPTLEKTYYNPDPNWGAVSDDLTASISRDEMSFDIPRQTYANWQAQFFVETGLAMHADKKYDFSFDITSTTTGGGQVKLLQTGDDGNFYFCDPIELEAGKTKQLSWTGLTGKNFSSTTIVFDFGFVPDNTKVDVKNIKLIEYSRKETGTGIDAIAAESLGLALRGMTLECTGEAAITVYDLSGRIVATATGSTLEVDSLGAGVYVARATDGNSTASLKFVRR